jgi:hypothetical protein
VSRPSGGSATGESLAGPGSDRWDLSAREAAAIVAAAVLFGLVVSLVRARSGSADLWYDDAWVAFATRAPLGQAAHIGLASPGFTIVARWWLGLVSDSTAWAQTFALLGFVAAPVMIFVAARTAGAQRWAAVFAAGLTTLNPMLLVESARLKQYTWEYVLSAAMLAVAAAVRRDGPTRRWTLTAGVLVVVATFFSASLLIPSGLLAVVLLVAFWAAFHRTDDPQARRDVRIRSAFLAVAGAIVLLMAATLLRNRPPVLQSMWRDGYLGTPASLGDKAQQAWELLRGFMSGFVFGGSTALLAIPVIALLVFAWRRWRTAWWLLLAPVFAVGLSAAQRYPLAIRGNSRIEAWLMPWICVLLALAVVEIGELAIVRNAGARVPGALASLLVVVVAVVFATAAWGHTITYPTTRSRVALRTLDRMRATGPIFVAFGVHPLDLVAPGPLHFVNDRTSDLGYSVDRLGGGLRILDVHPLDLTARELRPACGHTAAIAGADPRTIAAALLFLPCHALHEQVDTQGTPDIDDDTVVLTLGPAAPG